MPISPTKIRSRREKLGLTQAQAADRSGMQRVRWTEIETGRERNPSLDRLEAMAAALRCRVSSLLE